jgi:hypothetical protein
MTNQKNLVCPKSSGDIRRELGGESVVSLLLGSVEAKIAAL